MKYKSNVVYILYIHICICIYIYDMNDGINAGCGTCCIHFDFIREKGKWSLMVEGRYELILLYAQAWQHFN